MTCFFTSDLHGSIERYRKLYRTIESERPRAVFLGGDLLPHFNQPDDDRWESEAHPLVGFNRLKQVMVDAYPSVFLILGNDDPKSAQPDFQKGTEAGLWHYVHNAPAPCDEITVVGYSYVPPTPFRFKDWEKYDVSRYVPPGSIAPEGGLRSVGIDERRLRFETIAADLDKLATGLTVEKTIWLFHSPPHETNLDRVATDGKMIDYVPLDLHVGSIAIRRFIEQKQPRLTLHGHIHESTRLTGSWRDQLGRTIMFNGAHDGPELALIRFDPADPGAATQELL